MSLSMGHQAPIELCREHPEVIPVVLSRYLHLELPAYSRVRFADPNTRAVVATGHRCDAAIILEDGDRPVLGVVLELQSNRDDDKPFVWPRYLADLHADTRCDTYLVVIALNRSVARWARQPIRTFQPGRGLEPYVLGPDEFPRVHSEDDVRRAPWLSALCAILHANDPDGVEDALRTLRATKETQGDTKAVWLYDLLRAIMSEVHCQRMQEIIMLHPDVYLPKTDFERQQFKNGKADAVLRILAARMIEVTEGERQRILAEQNDSTINRWIDRAITVRTVAELF